MWLKVSNENLPCEHLCGGNKSISPQIKQLRLSTVWNSTGYLYYDRKVDPIPRSEFGILNIHGHRNVLVTSIKFCWQKDSDQLGAIINIDISTTAEHQTTRLGRILVRYINKRPAKFACEQGEDSRSKKSVCDEHWVLLTRHRSTWRIHNTPSPVSRKALSSLLRARPVWCGSGSFYIKCQRTRR